MDSLIPSPQEDSVWIIRPPGNGNTADFPMGLDAKSGPGVIWLCFAARSDGRPRPSKAGLGVDGRGRPSLHTRSSPSPARCRSLFVSARPCLGSAPFGPVQRTSPQPTGHRLTGKTMAVSHTRQRKFRVIILTPNVWRGATTSKSRDLVESFPTEMRTPAHSAKRLRPLHLRMTAPGVKYSRRGFTR